MGGPHANDRFRGPSPLAPLRSSRVSNMATAGIVAMRLCSPLARSPRCQTGPYPALPCLAMKYYMSSSTHSEVETRVASSRILFFFFRAHIISGYILLITNCLSSMRPKTKRRFK